MLTSLNVPGEDGFVYIWNVSTGLLKQNLSCVFHGPITAMAWIDEGENHAQAFAFGCADGSIHIYRRTGQEVSLSYAAHKTGLTMNCFSRITFSHQSQMHSNPKFKTWLSSLTTAESGPLVTGSCKYGNLTTVICVLPFQGNRAK
jgi:WD40 repeat protein